MDYSILYGRRFFKHFLVYILIFFVLLGGVAARTLDEARGRLALFGDSSLTVCAVKFLF